jgi:uncharacterized membrane protein YhfC
MFKLDKFWAADWDLLYRFFTSGNPPLALQLLVLNTIFFVLFLVRNATAKHRVRHNTAYMIQGLLIASNMAVLFRSEVMGYIHRLI